MKHSFQKALRIFKIISIIFVIVYWVWVPIDDYYFIKNYWNSAWKEYIEIWFLYFIVYFLTLSFYYWLISTSIIIINYKIIKKK